MRGFLGLLLTTPLVACASYTPRDVVQPSDISVQQAMHDVAVGLIDMKYTLKDKYKTGLIADEVTVTFNVTAGANDKSSLTLDVGAKTPGPTVVTADAKYGYEQAAQASRGNQIVVKFKNIWTADVNNIALADNDVVPAAKAKAAAPPNKSGAGGNAGAGGGAGADPAQVRQDAGLPPKEPRVEILSKGRGRRCPDPLRPSCQDILFQPEELFKQ